MASKPTKQSTPTKAADQKSKSANQPPIKDPKVDYYYLAKSLEQAKRIKESMEYMKKHVELGQPLDDEERTLFQSIFKDKFYSYRNAWRKYSEIESSEKDKAKAALVKKLRVKAEEEIKKVCEDVLGLVDKYLLPKATEVTPKVFYLKMKGDFGRYLAETQKSMNVVELAAIIAAAGQNYQQATDLSKSLNFIDKLRIGLALNFSVFYYEIAKNKDKAIAVAKEVYDEADRFLDSIPYEDRDKYEDSMALVRMIASNLHTWCPIVRDDSTETFD